MLSAASTASFSVSPAGDSLAQMHSSGRRRRRAAPRTRTERAADGIPLTVDLDVDDPRFAHRVRPHHRRTATRECDSPTSASRGSDFRSGAASHRARADELAFLTQRRALPRLAFSASAMRARGIQLACQPGVFFSPLRAIGAQPIDHADQQLDLFFQTIDGSRSTERVATADLPRRSPCAFKR